MHSKQVSYHRHQIFKCMQAKAFDPKLENNFSKVTTQTEQPILTDIQYANEFNKIYAIISKYKLKYNTIGENYIENQYANIIYTNSLQRISPIENANITNALICLVHYGTIDQDFMDMYNIGIIFYTRKDKQKPGVANNMRGLINCNNNMKLLYRYIKDYILEPVFNEGYIDTTIHVAKKCIVKETQLDGTLKRVIKFEYIANLASSIHSNPNPYIVLDLENAYGNVRWSDILHILTIYLSRVHGQRIGSNIARGIVHLLSHSVYTDAVLDEQLKHNKGLPQGCPISMDIFVICMDYIIREFIDNLATELGLQHGIDYLMQIYVDDILMYLISRSAMDLVNTVLARLDTHFSSFGFKLNMCKSKCSPSLAINYHCSLPVINPDFKYLGIYVESDPQRYLEIVEREIAYRWQHDHRFKTLAKLNDSAHALFYHNQTPGLINAKSDKLIQRIRGKLQFRLTPFATTNTERHAFMTAHGYPVLADILFG